MDTFWQEVRWGLRSLARSPGFTLLTAFTLALAIGANIMIFSLIDAIVLRELPVRDPSQFVILKWRANTWPDTRRDMMSMDCAIDSERNEGCSFSLPMFEQLRTMTDAFDEVVAISGSTQLALLGNGPASVASSRFVSGRFFHAVGVMPALGRAFDSTDDKAGAEPVVMLNYSYWQGAFGGDPSVVGKTIYLNNTPVTIIGVASREFPGLDPGSATEVWLPLSARSQLLRDSPTALAVGDDIWWLAIAARLKTGVALVQAQAVASDLFRNNVVYGPKVMLRAEDEPGIILMPTREGLVGLRKRFASPLTALMIAVITILLIACINVAGLMLARTAARETEMSVRLALGAGRGRIIRHLFTESLLISLAGGALGVLLAFWGTPILAAFLARGGLWPADFDVRPSPRVFIFTLAASVFAGILCALAPTLRALRMEVAGPLKSGGRQIAPAGRSPGSRLSLNHLLVVAQIALATVVLVGTGLLVRTLANLKSIDAGFNTNQLLLFGIDPALSGYKGQQTQNLYRDLLRRVESLPGVVSASYSRETLLGGNLIERELYVGGGTQDSGVQTRLLPVGPNFFKTMGIPLLAGREFTQADIDSTAKPVPAIVNETFAREYLRNQNPIGQSIGVSKGKTDLEIVGVVGDVKYKGLRDEVKPMAFLPLKEGRAYFELRTAVNPKSLVPAVRDVVGEIDKSLPLISTQTESEQIDRALFMERLVALLSGVFGLLALVVACMGLYGLLSNEVVRRTREIGIRMALGAQRSGILRLVVGQGLGLATAGIVIGIAIAFAITRYLQSFLYGIQPTDPLTFFAIAILLLAVTIAACFFPARRATSLDPVVALRYE